MKSMHDASFSSTQATPSAGATPRKKWYRWGVGAAVFGLLAGGGITWAAVSSGGTPASSASSARAAALNTALTDAAGDRADSPARVRWALARLRRSWLGGCASVGYAVSHEAPAPRHARTRPV